MEGNLQDLYFAIDQESKDSPEGGRSLKLCLDLCKIIRLLCLKDKDAFLQ